MQDTVTTPVTHEGAAKPHTKEIVTPYFVKDGRDPLETTNWVKREVPELGNGHRYYVEAPESWSERSVMIAAVHYLAPIDKDSIRNMIMRVVDTIAAWVAQDGTFSGKDLTIFRNELCYILLNRIGSFNSPVWYNLGVDEHPLISACFINSVQDSMDSITDLEKTEASIFQKGAGAGCNWSKLRSSYEKVRGMGLSSGPVSFMDAHDNYASKIKSGGKKRRAARLDSLNIGHPDAPHFIRAKADIEDMARSLLKAGFSADMNDPKSIQNILPFQSTNVSLRVPDEFMRAYEDQGGWQTRRILDGKVHETHDAREMMRSIAQACWECGDPGVQFDTTINEWSLIQDIEHLNGSNPCFPGSMRMLTDKGYLPIRQVVEDAVGGMYHRVMTLDGEWSHLVRFMVTGDNPIWEVELSDGRAIRCTPNHGWLVNGRKKVEAQHLQPGDVVGLCQKHIENQVSEALPVSSDLRDYHQKGEHHDLSTLNSQWTPGFAEVLGYLIGDGCVTDKGATWIIGKGSDQMEARITKWLEAQHIPFSTSRQNCTQIRVTRAPFVRFLKALGVLRVTSSHKRVPSSVYTAPSHIQAAFLSGYFGADGTVYGKEGHECEISASSVCLQLLRDTQLLLDQLGIRSEIAPDHREGSRKLRYTTVKGERRVYDSKASWRLMVDTRDQEDFVRLVSFSLDRKTQRASQLITARKNIKKKDSPITVVSVTDLGYTERTYNVTEPINHAIVVEGVEIAQCGEYIGADDSSCNLAAINVLPPNRDPLTLNEIRHCAQIFITAQDTLVDHAQYPTPAITANSRNYRDLGLGWTNLGARCMHEGYAYDSDEARKLVANIVSATTSAAYLQSIELSTKHGSFHRADECRDGILKVMRRHRDAAQNDNLASAGEWGTIVQRVKQGLYPRNASVSLAMPTGTVGLLMDCDTTGPEPAIALKAHKKLSYGGEMTLVIRTVKPALRNLGYDEKTIDAVLAQIESEGHVEGVVADDHLPVFDTALPTGPSKRSIPYMGHLNMLAAMQPHLSMAMSKTINMPEESTVEDVEQAIYEAWRLGIKCLALYRDNSKAAQAVYASRKEEKAEEEEMPLEWGERKKLPQTRRDCFTHKIDLAGTEVYLHVSPFPDTGMPGEIFFTTNVGSTLDGLLDSFAISVSIALQHGVPLRTLVDKYKGSKFAPDGWTDGRHYSSIMDLVACKMEEWFLKDPAAEIKLDPTEFRVAPTIVVEDRTPRTTGPLKPAVTGELCPNCGEFMVPNGGQNCRLCRNCGSTQGGCG